MAVVRSLIAAGAGEHAGPTLGPRGSRSYRAAVDPFDQSDPGPARLGAIAATGTHVAGRGLPASEISALAKKPLCCDSNSRTIGRDARRTRGAAKRPRFVAADSAAFGRRA